MEYLGLMVILVLPIYRALFKMHGRLTRVETICEFLYEKNGGKK